MGDSFDYLVGLDWNNVQRFVDEIPLDSESLVVADPATGPVPAILLERGAGVHESPFKEYAAAVTGGRINMAALGAIGAIVGLPLAALEESVRTTLNEKGEETVQAAFRCVENAYSNESSRERRLAPVGTTGSVRWNISGNEASGLGALRGGVRFVAAYPITPASEMLEWLAPRLEKVGGSLLQAEDELASVNMIIGASFGGVPSLTATSGPGLSLMVEGLGLAVASETPIVVANVMRGGPSTGIPTKSEQSDLNIALYGLHGDAPHLVLAPLSIRDCVSTTQWAVELAEHLQTVAIVLSDQALGQSRAVTEAPKALEETVSRVVARQPEAPYLRYLDTKTGISPMSHPGIANGLYTADGLEHNERGTPSSMARDHLAQLGKRRHKLQAFDYGPSWAEVRGDGRIAILTWGSTSGAAFEAAKRLVAEGHSARAVALRLLAPLRRESLASAIAGAEQVWVIEQNQGGQLFGYLNAERSLPANARSYARPGPLPLRPGEIVNAILEGDA